jgi:hypothetical protein
MTAREFYAWLDKLTPADSGDVKLEQVWQFDLAIQAASAPQAVALTNRNPKLARDYAAQEAVREALEKPNPLHAEIAAAANSYDRLALINAAPAAMRAEYADDLAILAYAQDALSASYRSLVLGE